MRVKHQLVLTIANDTELKDKFFDTDPTLAQVIVDNYQRSHSGIMKVDAAAAENLPLGDVDAVKGFYIKADQDGTFKLNGGTEVFQLRRADATSGSAKVFMECDITQVELTAPAGADMNVIFACWGDPTT